MKTVVISSRVPSWQKPSCINISIRSHLRKIVRIFSYLTHCHPADVSPASDLLLQVIIESTRKNPVWVSGPYLCLQSWWIKNSLPANVVWLLLGLKRESMKLALTPHNNIIILTLFSEHVRKNLVLVNVHASGVFGKRSMSTKKRSNFLHSN